MIPSTGPPFPCVRWVAMTHRNFVSRLPYNFTALEEEEEEEVGIKGFQATRQPAIWMGESGYVGVVPGFVSASSRGGVKVEFEDWKMRKVAGSEVVSPAYYAVELEDGGGRVLVEQSSSECRFFSILRRKESAKGWPWQPRT